MIVLRIVIILLGVIFGIYLFGIGFPKCKEQGFKFNLIDLFKQTPLATATGGYLLVLGIISFAASALLYYIWF